MKVDLENYSFDYGKVVSYPTASEGGRTFILNNESGFVVKKWAVDKVIFEGRTEERCDFLLLIEKETGNIYFWIELKGSDVIKACKQILNTREFVIIKGEVVEEARIITTKTYSPAFRDNAYIRLNTEMRKTGGKLKTYTNRGSEKI